jgi:hypothetical protein
MVRRGSLFPLALGAVAAAALLAGAPSARADVAEGTFTYTVHTERFGKVGAYTNIVRRDGVAIVVENRTEIAVRFLFATLFHLSAASTSVWRDGRLVAYSAVTDDDGEVSRVAGRADGEEFRIDGTAGRFAGPADAMPLNPWNAAIVRASAILSPKTGEAFPASVSGGAAETVEVGGVPTEARAFRIDTDRRTWVWYDGGDVPVKFAMERKRGREVLTFTLVRRE